MKLYGFIMKNVWKKKRISLWTILSGRNIREFNMSGKVEKKS